MAVHMYSPDGSLDQQYVANYVTLQIQEPLLRVQGVGDVSTRAARDYAIRIWIDPDKAAARNLTVDDIVTALRSHNVQIAAGNIGAPPFGKAAVSLPAAGAGAGPPRHAAAVRRHRRQARRGEPASPASPTSRGLSSARRTTPPTPISGYLKDGKPDDRARRRHRHPAAARHQRAEGR